jgi:NADPH2:quinone reductase
MSARHATALLAALLLAAAQAGAAPVRSTMQAAAIDAAGDASALTLHQLPVPQPDANEVLIAVDTAGVAIWDVSIRNHPDSGYIKNGHFPMVLGTDGAGIVAAVGSQVHGLKVGDQVYSYSWDNPKGGFYAQYVAVPAERVARIPRGLTLRQAGAIGTTALTAIQGVDDALHIKAGETLLIHGAAGGVGTLAIQFAKLRGARVLATVSSPDETELVKSLGADAVVDGRHGDIAAAAHAFAPDGLDAVLALAGGEPLQHAIASLKPGGRVAYPEGVQAVPRAAAGAAPIAYNAIPGPAEFARLNAAIEALKFQVPIAAQFPLAQAAQAQQRVEAGHVAGKVILQVR